MTECPIRALSGDIGCPKCNTALETKKAPFYLHDEYVGHFESLVCPICHYSVLTDQGYDEAINVASQFGMIGPAYEEQEIIREIENSVEEHHVTSATKVSLNLINDSIERLLNNQPIEAFNDVSTIVTPQIRTRKPNKSIIIN